jgi:SAM-dependent methyltransferase
MKYSKYWDEFYKKTYLKGSRKALWDVSPEYSIKIDMKVFKKYFDSEFPILDIGCGTGQQSQFLAKYYPKVIGVDVASNAIKIAKKMHKKDNLEFRMVDITQKRECKELFNMYGDMNLYMRGVMHQIKRPEQIQMIENLSILMGDKGKLFFMEVKDKLGSYFNKGVGRFNELPKQIQDIFVSNLPPFGLTLEHLPELFPVTTFEFLDYGDSTLYTNLKLPNGEHVRIPAIYGMVVKNI